MTEPENDIPTPASIPTTDGEWLITLNGRVVPEANQRLPAYRLPIGGKVTANTELDGKPVVLKVLFGEDGVDGVYLHHQFGNYSYEITYDLTPEDCDERGERWTTSTLDPEATVDIVPPTEVDDVLSYEEDEEQ